ncbi:MAG TPA: carboxymuconolactone decarboxylase family protein [Marmoricola sp.]|nr:carboxymuconolactone decarboxylase family protein [Nocardioidaceae bacterium]MCB8992709.1 carboxymuconolactone decarboxylase family protein [Nocardioidaceae bacterium]MCO5324124.1 carboxymuconolactone decarboxylase family protein [Nocardioidaceae bacterium]HMU35190.1 carboxymuconolactone decarboxylase family protein [Marmoricola sp.]HRV69311.1 carboxymuconolactone decarboxylase family protein [Marmoricola sp.]
MTHQQRLSIREVDPGAYTAVLALEKHVHSGPLEPELLELVKIRASQLNRCAWCLDMHTVDARKIGVPQRKIDLIAAFDEAPSLFTERERAALAFTEAVTLISHDGVADDVWASVTASFTDQEAVSLLMAVAAINVWNRMNVAVRTALSD